jgi:hypothetical protein
MIYEAETFGKFIKKIAIDYVRYGYVYYWAGFIPLEKDPKLIDKKLIKTYDIRLCRMARKRKRDKGEIVFVYVRYRHRIVLLATEGEGIENVKPKFTDIRKSPLRLGSITIGLQGKKPSVRMSEKRFKGLKKFLLSIALHNQWRLNNFFLTSFHFIPFQVS